MSTRVLVMYLGRIVESAPRRDLFATPGTPTRRGFFALRRVLIPRAGPRQSP